MLLYYFLFNCLFYQLVITSFFPIVIISSFFTHSQLIFSLLSPFYAMLISCLIITQFFHINAVKFFLYRSMLINPFPVFYSVFCQELYSRIMSLVTYLLLFEHRYPVVFHSNPYCIYCRLYYYRHMPIGMLWIYRLLFVCVCVCVCVCVRKIFVSDISGVGWHRAMKFCRVVDLGVHQVISPFGELWPRG